jgi:hypothetical protein
MITNQPKEWPNLGRETVQDPTKLLIIISEINQRLEDERNQEAEP